MKELYVNWNIRREAVVCLDTTQPICESMCNSYKDSCYSILRALGYELPESRVIALVDVVPYAYGTGKYLVLALDNDKRSPVIARVKGIGSVELSFYGIKLCDDVPTFGLFTFPGAVGCAVYPHLKEFIQVVKVDR